MYSCGPTAYWYQHIGNLRSYIFSDILKKVLQYNGYKVKHIINVTDVGHLTSDADEGEDKVEKAAAKEGKTAKEITRFYWKAFDNDLKKLNIVEPSKWAWATNYIKEQIKLIKKLEEKGYTYKTSDGIYFDTSKFAGYGQLAKIDVAGLKAGARIEMREKRNPTDFALWKFSPSLRASTELSRMSSGQVKRQQEWKSPWGIGFPGWHIECSAMSMKLLGQTIDVHTGGEDHISVHHSNEIAQSEAVSGKKFVNYWMHGAFLTFGGEKVSKSKGGLFTISELEQKNFKPLAFRYLCLTASYRTPLEFSLESLQNSQNSLLRLKNIISGLKKDGGSASRRINEKYLSEFNEAINDDLDTPRALAILWNLVRDEKAEGKIQTIKEMDKVLSLDLLKKEKIVVPAEIKKMAQNREEARAKKDWQKADQLRQEIEKRGYRVEDTEKGPRITKLF